MIIRTLTRGAAGLVLVAALGGCTTLQEMAALRHVAFDLERVDQVRIAGILVDGRRSYADLGSVDVAKLAGAVLAKDVPLDLVVHVKGQNPPENHVSARMVQMDWTFFLENTRTVSGHLAEAYVFPPGQPVDVPVVVHLDLADFFRTSARDAFDLALALAGAGTTPKEIRLEAMPTIETDLGPIRYPSPIVIRKTVGGR